MTIYENVATEAIASFFYHEPLWKKEILFNFLLDPFKLNFSNIIDVSTQDNLKGTIPDFTIKVKNNGKIEDKRFEVKINDAGLTEPETDSENRDAFLIRRGYLSSNKIPKECVILYWEDLFELIDKKGAMKEFARLALVREYMKEPELTLLLTPHEVAMFYSPETIRAVYTMKEKILKLCETFLDSKSDKYFGKYPLDTDEGIGFHFKDKKERNFFIGLDLNVPIEYSWAVEILIDNYKQSTDTYTNGYYAYFSLDKEILAKFNSEKDLQEAFNKNAEEVLKSIDK